MYLKSDCIKSRPYAQIIQIIDVTSKHASVLVPGFPFVILMKYPWHVFYKTYKFLRSLLTSVPLSSFVSRWPNWEKNVTRFYDDASAFRIVIHSPFQAAFVFPSFLPSYFLVSPLSWITARILVKTRRISSLTPLVRRMCSISKWSTPATGRRGITWHDAYTFGIWTFEDFTRACGVCGWKATTYWSWGLPPRLMRNTSLMTSNLFLFRRRRKRRFEKDFVMEWRRVMWRACC